MNIDDDSNSNSQQPLSSADILLEIRNDVKSLNSKFDNLSRSVSQLKTENKKLREQNSKLENTVSQLSDRLCSVETAISDQVKKQENLETFSRKNNLKFYGLPDSKNETPEES